jgi:TonB family protein
MKKPVIVFIFLSVIFFNASAQETCGMDADEAWNGDTAAMNKFLKTCGRIDTISYDEHNKLSKTKIHHQTIKMILNTGKVVHADSIFFITDQMPEFPGRDSALFQYLENNIHYPAAAKAKRIQGRVYVQFIVERDGSISRTKIVRGIGNGCDEEALRAIREMPKWIPGKMHGIPVQVQFILPVKFSL